MEISKIALCTALALTLTACGGGGSNDSPKTDNATEPTKASPLKVQVFNSCGQIEVVPTTFIFHDKDGVVLGTTKSEAGIGPDTLPKGTQHLTLLQFRDNLPGVPPFLKTFIDWDGQGIETLTLDRWGLQEKCNCRTLSVDANALNTQLGDYQMNIGGNDLSWKNITDVTTCKRKGEWSPLSVVARPNIEGTETYGAYFPVSDNTPDKISLPVNLMEASENTAEVLEVNWTGIEGAGLSYFKSYQDPTGYLSQYLPIRHEAGKTAYYLPKMGSNPIYRAEHTTHIDKGVIYSHQITVPIEDRSVTINLSDNGALYYEAIKPLLTVTKETGKEAIYDLTSFDNNGSELYLTILAENFTPLWIINAPIKGAIPELKLPDELMEKVETHRGKLTGISITGTDKPMAFQEYRRLVENAYTKSVETTKPLLPYYQTEALSIWAD
ncbi:hypothetical protein [Ferrimonas sp. YFM]|uniref:hypothetical protein n=1 Tax=Ferrimonas sp. YFM TaxID=3028878 RepID=UPI002572AC26|nr:hypothetical protein [Ferrimonas sp. YFM]BDY06986.1 hypothetical protein F0521_40270 [Ferrimonas sp. YFM]